MGAREPVGCFWEEEIMESGVANGNSGIEGEMAANQWQEVRCGSVVADRTMR
jgi:hypothetical protein